MNIYSAFVLKNVLDIFFHIKKAKILGNKGEVYSHKLLEANNDNFENRVEKSVLREEDQ